PYSMYSHMLYRYVLSVSPATTSPPVKAAHLFYCEDGVGISLELARAIASTSAEDPFVSCATRSSPSKAVNRSCATTSSPWSCRTVTLTAVGRGGWFGVGLGAVFATMYE